MRHRTWDTIRSNGHWKFWCGYLYAVYRFEDYIDLGLKHTGSCWINKNVERKMIISIVRKTKTKRESLEKKTVEKVRHGLFPLTTKSVLEVFHPFEHGNCAIMLGLGIVFRWFSQNFHVFNRTTEHWTYSHSLKIPTESVFNSLTHAYKLCWRAWMTRCVNILHA